MGEIADSLINGEFDYITGEYLGKPCGYPRSIHDKRNYGKEKINEAFAPVKGVQNFLTINQCNGAKEKRQIVKAWAESVGYDYVYNGFDKTCVEISKQFIEFKVWFNQRKK